MSTCNYNTDYCVYTTQVSIRINVSYCVYEQNKYVYKYTGRIKLEFERILHEFVTIFSSSQNTYNAFSPHSAYGCFESS